MYVELWCWITWAVLYRNLFLSLSSLSLMSSSLDRAEQYWSELCRCCMWCRWSHFPYTDTWECVNQQFIFLPGPSSVLWENTIIPLSLSLSASLLCFSLSGWFYWLRELIGWIRWWKWLDEMFGSDVIGWESWRMWLNEMFGVMWLDAVFLDAQLLLCPKA